MSHSTTEREEKKMRVRIYKPSQPMQHPLTILREMGAGVMEGRELAWRLFLRDTRAQFRQTFFGLLWAFIPPLVSALTFIFLGSQGLFNPGETGIPYAAFALMGTLLWQVFVDALGAPVREVTAAKGMLVKINFPREAILVNGLYKVIFNFIIRMVILLPILIYLKLPLSLDILVFPLAMLAMIVVGFALGIVLVPVGGLYGDIQRVLPVLTGFWMLLTPVVYPPRTEGLLGFLSVWNPLSPLMVTARESLMGAGFTALPGLAIVFVLGFILLLGGLIGYRVALPHIIARMGG